MIVTALLAALAGLLAGEHGTPEELRANPDPLVHQFVYGEAEGPVAYQYPSGDYAAELRMGQRRAAA